MSEKEYLLNEAQTLLICLVADTPVAADLRHEVVRVFLAWRHGQLKAASIEGAAICAPVTRKVLKDFDAKVLK